MKPRYDIYSSIDSGTFIRIHGDFHGNELVEIGYAAMKREIGNG